MNLVILRGRLGQDPELSYTASGTPKVRLSLATSRRWTDKASGEKKEQTQWHRVILWDRLADIASRYLAKGKEVLVTGEIQTRQYQDRDGRTAYVTEIMGRELELIGGRGEGGAGEGAGMGATPGGGANGANGRGSPSQATAVGAGYPGAGGGTGTRPASGQAPGYTSDMPVPFDDDIPF